jgi:hypothetical protein
VEGGAVSVSVVSVAVVEAVVVVVEEEEEEEEEEGGGVLPSELMLLVCKARSQ